MKKSTLNAVLVILLIAVLTLGCNNVQKENAAKEPSKMDWWSEARYGMFIHWGLYSILAGEWNGEIKYAEWIRSNAKIPVEVYDTLVNHFNPVKFNADEWVKMAKDAGMKYIVITSKHHDGFCLFDSEYTDFDVMSTPFKRDILGELSTACHEQDMVLCFYHSIMDWHNPDYLPRREWEITRSTEGADYDRYVAYLKNQLKELTTKYGAIGVLWFDGEWESTWTHERGVDLYNYVIGLQPGIIVNNRVDTGREGMAGMNSSSEFVGDFGTPEQEVPATGFPGTYWESCITLNNNWGYVKNDNNWKSPKDVIRMLTDIASKGGNLLLNIGPKPDGTFPDESINILSKTGEWMKKNGSSIYGTGPSPFSNLKWGRCTTKPDGANTILYLHVFDWPEDGKLLVQGITNKVKGVWMLDGGQKIKAKTIGTDIQISLPAEWHDELSTVVVLKIAGKPVVFNAPEVEPASGIFVEKTDISIADIPAGAVVRYTLDGTEPSSSSPEYVAPVEITGNTRFTAAYFIKGVRVGSLTERQYKKAEPMAATEVNKYEPGLNYSYFTGKFELIPNLASMKPASKGILPEVLIAPESAPEYFAQSFSGYINIPTDGVYEFSLLSDDGSRLFINDQLTVDNDGLHGTTTKSKEIALSKGFHKIQIEYIQNGGGKVLACNVEGPQGVLDLKSVLVH